MFNFDQETAAERPITEKKEQSISELQNLSISVINNELEKNEHLASIIYRACSQLGINPNDFKKAALGYAMFFSDMDATNEVYDQEVASLVTFFYGQLTGSYHRERHGVTHKWLKEINPQKIVDVGYSSPQDYLLDEDFATGKDITLIEGTAVAEKVSRVILNMEHISQEKIIFKSEDMNDYRYAGEADAYIFLDSIEHTDDPTKYLQTQVDNSKTGSHFIFSIPIGKIDSFKNVHFGEWLTNEDAKKWLEQSGLKVLQEESAIPNLKVDNFAKLIIGGFHNELFLCKKPSQYDSLVSTGESFAEKYVSENKKFYESHNGEQLPIQYLLTEIDKTLENSIVADIGCGHAPDLSRYLSGGAKQVFLIDPSKEMIRLAKKEHANADANTEYHVGDFIHTELPDSTIDVAISRFSIHYNKDLEAVFKEAHRFLRNGGRLFVLAPHPEDAEYQTLGKDGAGNEQIKLKLYDSTTLVYPRHYLNEYFSPYVLENFNIIGQKTFSDEDLQRVTSTPHNVMLYFCLEKK